MRRSRCATKSFGCLALLLFAGSANAQFTLFSQNALHLGWGKDPYYTKKNDYLTQCVISIATCPGTANTPDVAIIQEVMNGNEIDTLYAGTPGTYQVYVSELQGHSSYVEAYAFLVRNVTTTNTCCSVTPFPTGTNPLVKYTGGGFSRPPIGLVVAQSGKETWIVDYHAVFGKVPARRTEVSNVGYAIRAFQSTQMGSLNPHTVNAFVVGGDWNFPHDDAAFGNIQTNAGVSILIGPTGLTSLKPKGVGLSSAYDHFVWAPSLINGTSATILNPPPGGVSLPDFRNGFSDHLGISISVQIK
jgi:hypothetical protein